MYLHVHIFLASDTFAHGRPVPAASVQLAPVPRRSEWAWLVARAGAAQRGGGREG